MIVSIEDARRFSDELRRIRAGPGVDEKPEGLGIVRFVASCPDGAAGCVGRAAEVLEVVVRNSMTGWLDDEFWPAVLPDWFVKACGPESTPEESAAWLAWWRTLSSVEKAKAEASVQWSLLDWLDWFRPGERQWYWWDVLPRDQVVVDIAVAVDEWPFAWGALSWLFRASGASDVVAER